MTFWSLKILSRWQTCFLLLTIGTKSCCSHCMCYWGTFYRWCSEDDPIWGCRCYGGWRHRVQHWCIINCRILQVNYEWSLVSSVSINHDSNSLFLCPYFVCYLLNLIMETCRSRALTTKYNSNPQEASRPFDSGRDGFV